MFEKPGTRPNRLSHIGIQTYNIEKIRDWYRLLLNGEVVSERIPDFCTVTCDREHHRIAIIGLKGTPPPKSHSMAGIFHSAFGMRSIFDLLENYERARDFCIRPVRCVHHGLTISLYYKDPDDTQCELLVDCYPTFEKSVEFLRGPVFAHTLGAPGYFDPEEMLARMKGGATEAELLYYDKEMAMKIDFEAERRKTRAINAGLASQADGADGIKIP